MDAPTPVIRAPLDSLPNEQLANSITLIDPPITFEKLPHALRPGSQAFGRRETLQAIQALCCHYRTHFVNVSDGVGFPWQLWLCNLVHSAEIVGVGIVQVHVASSLQQIGANPVKWGWPFTDFIAVHRQDKSLCLVNPRRQSYAPTDPSGIIMEYKSERDVATFPDTVVAEDLWTQLRLIPETWRFST